MASEAQGLSDIAKRYAAALYELADDQKALDRVAEDLRGLKSLIAESEDLRRLIRSPLIDRQDQARAMAAVIETAGCDDLTRRFVAVVARNRRLFVLTPMIDAYLAILAERRGEVRASVTSARALSDDQFDALADALKRSMGSNVSVDVDVDPALIGGVVVRVGSRMFDNSIRTKLQKLQLAMKGVG